MTWLTTLTWHDAEAHAGATLVVPLGSTEQHGPHLPLDTDTRIAVALAARAAEGLDGVVVGPAIPYGASGEHQQFPGTVSAGTTAVARYLLELVRSAVPPFGEVVVVNGHGGNAAALAWVGARCEAEGRRFRSWSPTLPDGDLHAGRVETSIVLALDPDAVRSDRIEPGTTLDPGELTRLRDEGVRGVSPSGVLGDPTGASAEAGVELLDRLGRQLRALLSSR